MECKIWIASYFDSPPPYPIEFPAEEFERKSGHWLTQETVWRHIGTVDSLEAARYMVENGESSYRDSNGICYFMEYVPSDEFYCYFVKIEYGDTIEYYDRYVPGKKTRYARRIAEEKM